MKTLQRMFIGIASAALWPIYVGLLAALARNGPWPRGVGRPVSFVLAVVAVAMFASAMVKWFFRRGGWVEEAFGVPEEVLRQLRRARIALLIAGAIFILPEQMIDRGLITSSGRPIVATTIGHLLILGFEVSVWLGLSRLIRSGGPLGKWFATAPDQLGWAGRHRRAVRFVFLAGMAGVIALESRGYGFTARRVASASVQTIFLALLGWGAHRVSVALIAKNCWRWVRRETKHAAGANEEQLAPPADLPSRVRHLVVWGVPILVAIIGLYVWDVDLALFNYVGAQPLWKLTAETAITVGDVFAGGLIFVLTAGAWRYLSTIFALFVYPRMPEDPGIRFAVLTLCRYAVLAVGVLAGLSSIHMGLDKIGVVLAALGVGLGFGLQEIVSNFVSGIILLIERPIRVGDVVTVAAMTGKVDRINIRATTLINAENQSLIIPNREFITGNLINWTHKDKIIRFSIGVTVAHGTDPDAVVGLLLSIARADSEVLGNPVPSAYFESFGPSALNFILHIHVPEPSFTGKVKHRLCTQIQKQFAEAGIEIPLPLQELRVEPGVFDSMARNAAHSIGMRIDPAETSTGPPHLGMIATKATVRRDG